MSESFVSPVSMLRHRDDEWVDEIRLTTVPRLKTSGLSGDEWRVSALVQYLRNGVVVYEESFSRLTMALAYLARHAVGLHPGDFKDLYDRLPREVYRALDENYCFQPGCSEPWTVEYRQLTRACREGHVTDAQEYTDYRRRFCDKHKDRGDASLDDSMRNYEAVLP